MLLQTSYLIIIFFACFFQGVVGFGFAFFVAPLLMLFLSKTTIISLIMMISIFLNTFLLIGNKAKIRIDLILILFLSSIIGMIIGMIILKNISTNLFQILVCVNIIFFSLVSMLIKIKLPKNILLNFFVGFISGLLNTSTSLSGPPVAILLENQQLGKEEFRKTLAIFFLLMNIFSLIIFTFNRLIGEREFLMGLSALPFVLIAGYFGSRVEKSISVRSFRKIVFISIILMTIFSLIYVI